MIPVPHYLKNNSKIIKHNKSNIQLSFICDCGCDTFSLYENDYTIEESKIIHSYEEEFSKIFKGSWDYTITRDDNGKLHHWRLYTPLGLYGFKKEVFPPQEPFFAFIKIVKVKCSHCQKEHILFDNRIHGYDGVFNKNTEDIMNYHSLFKQKYDNVRIEIKIENDPSLDVFIENTGIECNENQYSNAYGWISICAINHSKKRKIVYECETT